MENKTETTIAGDVTSNAITVSKPASGPCPSCGYCPHCGRGGHQAQPWYPLYPLYPQPWYPPTTVPGWVPGWLPGTKITYISNGA